MLMLKIFTDGGSRGNPGIAGAGVHVEDQNQKTVFEQAVFLGKKTNNEAEYLAFLSSLQWLKTFTNSDLKSVEYNLDSKLLVEQINRRWKIKEARLQTLAQQCWTILATLPYPVVIKHILREKNAQADALANQAMDQATEK